MPQIEKMTTPTPAGYSIRKFVMGASQSAISKSIKSVLGDDDDLYAFPGDPLYKLRDAKPYNLDIPIKPSAVTYPKTTAQVAAIIKCAVGAGLKVQARCGGHSYANYCTRNLIISPLPKRLYLVADPGKVLGVWMALWSLT